MNEQIIELANKANEQVGYTFKLEDDKKLHELMEKFAQLIVRKCADVCAKQAMQTAMFSSGQSTRAAYACEQAIKQQFGLDA